jgi:ribosomal protein S18 acetylase RimI-like enzyme
MVSFGEWQIRKFLRSNAERTSSMSGATVRPAKAGDGKQLIKLIDIASNGFVRHLFAMDKPPGQTVDEYILSRMNNPDSGLSLSKLWVAEINGAIAGFIALDEVPEDPGPISADTPAMFRPLTELENEAPGCCLINLVATYPEFRGQGAGATLLKFAETRRGRNGLCLVVGDTNTAAQEFYRHIGYRITGRRPVVKEGWETPYSDWLLMVKARDLHAPSNKDSCKPEAAVPSFKAND